MTEHSFDQNETPFGRIRRQVVELTVGQARLGECQQTNLRAPYK
jgi:hypothetical protein